LKIHESISLFIASDSALLNPAAEAIRESATGFTVLGDLDFLDLGDLNRDGEGDFISIFDFETFTTFTGDLALTNVAITALGVGDLALGVGDLALGVGDLALGVGDLALGVGDLALGVGDVALGVGDLALGVGDLALGVGDLALGVGDVALGDAFFLLHTLRSLFIKTLTSL
jgi:hypothetical protein